MINPHTRTRRDLGLFFTGMISTMLLTATGISCTDTKFKAPPNLPLSYLECIELTTDRLENYYFNHTPIYFWLPTGEEVLDDRPIIIKDIELANGMVDNQDRHLVHITEKITARLMSVYQMEGITVGDEVDIIGICRGFSDKQDYITLTDCFIQPSGTLGLPIDTRDPGSLFGY